jgi:hypothetical protein
MGMGNTDECSHGHGPAFSSTSIINVMLLQLSELLFFIIENGGTMYNYSPGSKHDSTAYSSFALNRTGYDHRNPKHEIK